jgi:hypothetical protein
MKLPNVPDRRTFDDAHVRARLLRYLDARGYRPLTEVALAYNRTRIDVIGMDPRGVLCGFEIKSEADTLRRLNMQARRYRRYFEKLYLVGAEGHLEDAMKVLPHYWGIWGVRAHASGIHIIRRTPPSRSPRANRHQKAAPLAALMRKQELIVALGTIASDSTLDRLNRTQLAALCAERLSIREIERHLFESLHARCQAAGQS